METKNSWVIALQMTKWPYKTPAVRWFDMVLRKDMTWYSPDGGVRSTVLTYPTKEEAATALAAAVAAKVQFAEYAEPAETDDLVDEGEGFGLGTAMDDMGLRPAGFKPEKRGGGRCRKCGSPLANGLCACGADAR